MTCCKYCGSSGIVESEQIFGNGTKHIRVECGDCGRFQQFKPQKTDENFMMPEGTKYCGKTIPWIIEHDRKYALWVSENFRDNIKNRFKRLLASQEE